MSRAAIIGGGFGGIAAALRLRAKAYDVTIFDRCRRLGGRAQVFERDGFRYDAGPTVITAPFLFEELFSLFGKDIRDYVDIVPLDVWYRFRFADGSTFDYGGSVENILREIRRISPEDESGYLSLLEESRRIYEVGYEQLADQPFHTFSDMVKITPEMLNLGIHRSVWDLVASHLKNDKIRQAFSVQPLLLGGNPFDTTCIYNLIHFLERAHGVHFAMGGTGALVDGLSTLMAEEGINIRLEETVTNLKTENSRITRMELASNETFDCDLVVSNADPAHLYTNLLPHTDIKLSAKIKAKHAKKSMGLFVLFFGTDTKYPDVKHHTIWLGSRYKSLLNDIFNRKVLADDFSLYLHRPTATDLNFAPEGCDSFYALVPVPNLQGDIDWETQGPALRDRVMKALQETLLPNLTNHLVHDFWMTPEDFSQDYLSPAGAGFSIAPSFTQSAWFRFHNKAEGPENLYLVGAGTHPGAGLPGVLSSAKVLEHLIGPAAGQSKENCYMQAAE